MRQVVPLSFLLLTMVTVLAACGDDDEADSNSADTGAATTSTAATEADHDDDLVAEGRQVYLDVGCAHCHGQEAEGSMMGPALAGHTPEQVRRQVRNPVGMMPRFDEGDLDDDELEALTAYIDSFEGEHGHGFEPGATESTHLLMALIALKAHDVGEVHHHLDHAREFTDDAELQEQVAELAAMLDAGGMHDVEHMIEGMLKETELELVTMVTLHLEIAVQALRLDDPDDARHHLEHALEAEASPELRAMMQDAIDAIDGGDLHEAEDLVNEILGKPDLDEG